jgi:Glycosyltransferase family 87
VALPAVLRMFWVGSLVAFGLMVLVGYVEFRMGYPVPHYNPLGGARYEDLMEFPPVYQMLHTAEFFEGVNNTSRVTYPPLGMVLFAVLYGSGHPIGVYLGTAAVWLAACVWGVRRGLMAEGIGGMTATLFPLTVALVSFPIAGLLQRGNIELLVWVFAGAGTWLFVRGREDAAAAMWGLAAAVKLYPVVLLGLLLPRGKWRAFGVGVGTLVGVTLLSLKWLGPTVGVAWHGAVKNVFRYQGIRVGEWSLHELAANHSAFGLAKLVGVVAGLPPARLTLPYYALAAVLMGWAFFVRLWRMPVANQLLALTAFMVALPPISYFYALVHLYAAWVVLVFVAVRAGQAGVRVRGLKAAMVLFVGLFASFMLFTFPRAGLFGGLVQACLLIAVWVCAVEFPLDWQKLPYRIE